MSANAFPVRHAAVIGTGPAGEAAGHRLLDAGWSVSFFDEQPRSGGNIGRVGIAADATSLERLAADSTAASLRLSTQVLAVTAAREVVFRPGGEAESVVETQPFDAVVLACGAYDLHLPLVLERDARVATAGALQALLKGQGIVPEGPVVVAGAGPFLYVVAANLAAAGADVTHVIDRLRLSDYSRLLPSGLAIPGNLVEYLRHRLTLRRRGTRLLRGRRVISMVAGELWLDDGERLACHQLGLTEAFVAQSQLARSAGCRQRYHAEGGYWISETDVMGRTSVPGIIVCGEGQGVRGWRHARLSGELAALAVREDAGETVTVPPELLKRRESLTRFGAALERTLRRGEPRLDDRSVVCHCERATAGQVREALALGLDDLSSIKVVTRCGMGPCQGRYCEPLICRLIEAEGKTPRAPFNQRVMTRPARASEFVRMPSDERPAGEAP